MAQCTYQEQYMKRLLSLASAAALLLGICAGTALADVQSAHHFDVSVWNTVTHDYPVTGSMDLVYHSDGVVTGYYHPANLPSFIPIQGGRSGDNIWLAIGIHGVWHLDGHFNANGKIVGSAYSNIQTPDRNIQKFGAPVDLNRSAGLYNFVATPKSTSYGP
jgi:hypothetical protein